MRGGKAGLEYPWGNTISYGRANYGGDTTLVGTYAANGYGLFDMAGNVWEWCLDEYDADFYSKSPRRNPLSGVRGNTTANLDVLVNNFRNAKSSRVLRGGCCYYSPRLMRVANRHRYSLSYADPHSGFR